MITRALVGLLVAAALAAPSASAGGSGSPATTALDPQNPWVRNDRVRLGAQPNRTAPNPSNPVVRNDEAHFRALPIESPAAVIVRVDGGFDWVAVAVGAAGSAGLFLVAGVGIAETRRRRRGELARA